MKKHSVRLLALLLAVVMVLSVMPTMALAEGEAKTATLVTDVTTLKVGDEVVIAAKDADFALGTNQKTNNREAVAVTKDGSKLTLTEKVQTLTLQNGTKENTFAFYTGSGYLYAAGKSKAQGADKNQNHLKTGKTLTDNASWKIEIAEGAASVVAQGENGCNILRYNARNTLFSAYSSGQDDIAIYKLDAAEPARESGLIAPADMQAGDTVVIFNPANGKALSTEYNGFYNKGTDVTMTDGTLTGWTNADLWTVGLNADGSFTFSTSEGKKLSMDVQYSSTPLDKANTAWNVLPAATDGCYYIQNTGRSSYLEWFADKNNWSSYGSIGNNEALFAQQIYLVVDSGEQPDPEPEPTPTPGALFKDGEQIVIYNPANMKALSTEYSGFYNKGTDVTMTGGTLSGWTDADVWTVGVNADGTYTFSTSEGKKLSMDTQFSSTPLDKVNTAWNVLPAATDGCYYIQNTGRSSYLEWFAEKNNWSSYGSIGNNEALFAQAFYRVRKSGIVTSLSDGDTVVVFNPANMKALSTEYSGFYNKGTDVTIADGKLSGYTKADLWTVGVNADGTYTFSTSEGKKLSMDTQFSSTPLDKVNTAWNVLPAATENCVYIQNAARGSYLEWFADKNNWSSYGTIGNNEALFAQQFYLVVDDGSDLPSGELPKAGDKVVIYNQNAKAVLAEQIGTESPSINKAAAEIVDSKAVPANGAVVFEVEQNGEYLRFKNETYGYLCSNGTGNNAFYCKAFDDSIKTEDADWLVRTCSGGVGGYEMEHRTAKFNGRHSQWLEYYADSFKTYSMYNVTDYTIYSFFFYPVAEGVKLHKGIVNDPQVVFGTPQDAFKGAEYALTFTIDAPFGVEGMPEVTVNGEKYVPTLSDGTYTVIIPGEKVTGETLDVTVSAKDTENTAFTGTIQIAVKDEPVISNVTPAQGAETKENKRPVISAEITNAGENADVTMTVNGEKVNAVYQGGKVTYTPKDDMADGKVTVTVTVKRADEKTAEKTWSFTVGEAKSRLYFGQLHSHTQYSDGSGTLESALKYVADLPASANVDFVAFTDHSNYFDKTGEVNPEEALYDMSKATAYSQDRWASYKDAVAVFNTEKAGSMVAIAGFEMTWSGGPGHINTFNTPGIVSRNNKTLNNKTDDAGMKAYYALLSKPEGASSISQFNHPGTTFGTFKDFAYWDAVIDSRMYLVEVGNGEGQIGAGGYYPSYSEYIKALDKGWHLAPTNNQDNHKGRWGNANDARDVILTDDFSEQGIYQAMRDMRIYATEDKNLEIGYTVNGMPLGSIITEVPEKLTFDISFYDPDPTDSIKKVELVVNSGKVAYKWDSATELANGAVSVELAPEYSYYFVRITQGDGDIAVTAPVWVGESLKLGISSAVCGTATPVTDEELTITTTLFNSENADAVIQSVTYTVNGKELEGTKDGATTVPASGTSAVTFRYTPKAARVMTVTVTAVLTLKDKDYTFTKDVTLDVLNASKLVYIGIDASHYNEYVAGNYKDSMGNFGNLAAEYSVRTVQLNTSEELIAACGNTKYKALILTAPSRRLEAAQKDPKTYSEAELAAIKAFNEMGGTVILAGWSDNYENYPVIQENPAIKHMAETQNDVLAALGSSLRISDDATYDDVRSAADGVDKWRLYFSTYNMDHPLLKGVIFDAEHPFDKLYTERFSHYGGASIYAVDEKGEPTSAMPATVSPVVYGHATTYSVDVDNDGRGGAGVPKYAYAEGDNRLMVMATEQLAGKGQIIVSGAAFMSNFEVQAQVDNAAEKNYSNYRICENLLAMFNTTEITPIKTVQEEPDEGVKFTIEGIVTSNASGYDKDTAFFDCIYLQDETAGINAFPVAGNFKIGDKVRITGTTSSYQGERQIAVTSIAKLGEGEAPAPKAVTAAQLENKGFLGSLVTVEGTATKIEYSNGLIQTIMVRDDSGKEARVFIDGYITTAKDVENAAVGCHVKATGLASYDDTFVLADGTPIAQRIRIRDRADVVCTAGETPVKTWNITYVLDGGVINGDYPTTYEEGTVTVLPTDVTKDGYTFLGWFTAAEGGDKVTQIEAAETGDKEFFAHWQKNETPVKTWNIFYFTDGGVINGVYPTTYVEGKGAKLPTSVTKKGYTFLGWFTKDGVRITRIGAEATGDVTVYAHWTLDALYPSVLDAIFGDMDFSDVSPRDWFYKDVEYVYEKGIMDGIDKHTFAPDANLTRGMLVTILYRIEGEPVTRGSTDFTDVELGRWYTKAVAWAASKDIVNGYGGGKFGPNDPVTREQLTTILYRYTAYKGESTAAFSGNLNRFKDAASVSNYAVDAANWAVGEGIINGSGDLFMPKSNATRAQVAAIIHRYLAG